MHYVFVKHYLNQDGIAFFNKTWFPKVLEAIKSQPDLIDIVSKADLENSTLKHITLCFENQNTLLAWAETDLHEALLNNLDEYRTQAWAYAAIDLEDGKSIDADSTLLDWQLVKTA